MPKVFINCPFDDEYFPLLRAMLFTVKYAGLEPMIAQTSDSGQVRIKKIIKMMKQAEYSIHDISRIEALNDGDLPRFNMSFECGMDFGIRDCDGYTNKKFLILDKEPYRYKEVLSDISGNDIFAHNNEDMELVKRLRNWLYHHIDNVASFKEIWESFKTFDYHYKSTLKEMNLNPDDIHEIPFAEIVGMVQEFVGED